MDFARCIAIENKAEYERLLGRLGVTTELGIRCLFVCGDS
jgi:hypothetical protein